MRTSLEETIEDVLDELQHGIDTVSRELISDSLPGTDPFLIRYRDGRFPLLEALSAKAQLLAALANLRASE